MSSLANIIKNDNDGVQRKSPSSTRASLRERVRQTARQIESEMIMEALEQHRWNRRRAAEALKISYRSLMYKMKSGNLRGDAPLPEVGSGLREDCGE